MNDAKKCLEQRGDQVVKTRVKGDLKQTLLFLTRAKEAGFRDFLNDIGERGVESLAKATPKDTGKTAASWSYDVSKTARGYRITWSNDNFSENVPIAILIQYGFTTRMGTIVEGRDYINPALKPIFDSILDELNAYILM